MIAFLLSFVTHPLNTLVALVAGAFLHVTLKALALRIKAKFVSTVAKV
jgi:hypothetical protein